MSGGDYSGYRDWKGWSDLRFGQPDLAADVYFAAELHRAGLGPLHCANLLEIGAGNGTFAQWSVDQGASYQGTEMVPELVAAGCKAGFRMFSGECNLREKIEADSIDAAVAFDVFEHLSLEELQALLGQLISCLKPGGRIVGRVPSGDSPFARGIQHGDVTHKTVLGSSAVRQIAMACGLEVLQIREPAFPVFGLGLRAALRRGLVRVARALAFPVLRSVFMGDGQAVLTPNMVFVLRKPS